MSTAEVLVLDDEEIVCDRVKEHLEKKGFRVETFTQSTKALSRLGEKRFDVVVTDLKMSGPTGLDVLRHVQEHSPATEVIIITAYASIEVANEAEIVGAFGFVCKPFQLEEVHKLVKAAAKKAMKQR